MTTNGILLAKYAADLKKAGLHRVNVSLDTLKPERFKNVCRGSNEGADINSVLSGIEAARTAGLNPVKINVVVMAGENDDEILDFARKTIDEEWHVRFIELMPYAGHNGQYSCRPDRFRNEEKNRPVGQDVSLQTQPGQWSG